MKRSRLQIDKPINQYPPITMDLLTEAYGWTTEYAAMLKGFRLLAVSCRQAKLAIGTARGSNGKRSVPSV